MTQFEEGSQQQGHPRERGKSSRRGLGRPGVIFLYTFVSEGQRLCFNRKYDSLITILLIISVLCESSHHLQETSLRSTKTTPENRACVSDMEQGRVSYPRVVLHVSEALFSFHLLLCKGLVGSAGGQSLTTSSLVYVFVSVFICVHAGRCAHICMYVWKSEMLGVFLSHLSSFFGSRVSY